MARPHFRKGSLWGQSLGNKWLGSVCNSLLQVQEVYILVYILGSRGMHVTGPSVYGGQDLIEIVCVCILDLGLFRVSGVSQVEVRIRY